VNLICYIKLAAVIEELSKKGRGKRSEVVEVNEQLKGNENKVERKKLCVPTNILRKFLWE
jgi:hypothetical protein